MEIKSGDKAMAAEVFQRTHARASFAGMRRTSGRLRSSTLHDIELQDGLQPVAKLAASTPLLLHLVLVFLWPSCAEQRCCRPLR